MSHALSRLRAYFDDPLLVRASQGMTPTPRASELAALRLALEQVRQAVQPSAPFDPATAKRSFVLVTTDYGETVVLAPLMARLGQQAPGVNLRASPEILDWSDRLQDGSCDLFVGPVFKNAPPGLRTAGLFHERFVCLLRRDHPLGRRKLTLQRFAQMDHVLVAPGGRSGSAVDDALAKQGKRRRVAVMVPHFLVAPLIVAQTDLIITLPQRTAETFARLFPLRIIAPPVELTGFTVCQVWHERVHRDPCHCWMREQVAAVAKAPAIHRTTGST